MALTLTQTQTFENTTCFRCGTIVVMHAEFYRDRVRDKAAWFCINGHQQVFVGESVEETLRKKLVSKELELAQERTRIATKDRAIAALKGAARRTKTRVQNGVCPCCNRTFIALGRHMATKHPDWKEQEIG